MMGLALTVGSGRDGAKTCFRYPLPPSESCMSSPAKSEERPSFGRAPLSLPEQFFRLEGDFFAKLFTPKALMCDQIFQLEIDELLYISHPVCVPHKFTGSSEKSNASEANSKVSNDREITLFNVIFAIDCDRARETSANQSVINKDFREYKHAAQQLAMTQKWEEDRCSYVSEQV